MADVTVLLSSAGRRGALVGALRDGGEVAGCSVRVVAADLSPLSAAGHLADAFHLVPRVDSAEFVGAMVDLVRREGVDVIVPTIDTELPVLAANRSTFAAAGARALVSDPATIEICFDKARSSRWLSERRHRPHRRAG
jgi:carbamoyl-phosphate synthase large subunit